MPTVLVAFESALRQHEIESALLAEGFDVLLASDGDEAVALAEVYRPDLIMCSMGLPRQSSFLILERLAMNLDYPLPAIVVAKWQDCGDRHVAYLGMLGATVVEEPVKAEQLVEAVCSINSEKVV